MDNLDEKEIESILEEIKYAISNFVNISLKVDKKLPQASNVVFSKGYELKDERLSKNFEDTEDITLDNIGLAVKYDRKGIMPLLFHSYFKEIPDDLFENMNENINKLYEASIV